MNDMDLLARLRLCDADLAEEAADRIERLHSLLGEAREALQELDCLRVEGACADDELGAIAGEKVAAFVQRYLAVLAKLEFEI